MLTWTASNGPKRYMDVPPHISDEDEEEIMRDFYMIDPYRTARLRRAAPGNEDINDLLDIDPEEELNFH